MKDKKIWQLIYDCLQEEVAIVLMIVIENSGSSPGRAGFKMAVAEDGTLEGTIGGGVMEHNLVEEARKMLKNGDSASILRHQIHDKAAAAYRSGMICAGAQTVALCPLQIKDLPVIKKILQAIKKRQAGILHISPTNIIFSTQKMAGYHTRFEAHEWVYEENLSLINTAYIIGGGHVSLALSRILATLDFHIVVFDERSEVSTLKNNSYAHEKIITSYDQIRDQISDGDQNYAVIMTPSHRADKFVLQQLIDKQLRYLGMMGSSSKVKEIFDLMRQDGISDEKLQCVHAPIGLSICSHTPAEIAVSIAAEMIQIKNR